MVSAARIELSLEAAIARATGPSCPPKLAKAVHHAVFPGGARVRPQLCLAVSEACGDPDETITDGAAAAIELLHCASLVHDDLPCFDDAELRRGKKTVHVLYGEPVALLAGDALIVEAFRTLTFAALPDCEKLGALVATVSEAVGMPGGIVAGQAWESEPEIDIARYHRAKTGALFVGSVRAGAIAAGHDPEPWTRLGEKIGEAYQLADDLLDAAGTMSECGKPVLQDAAHERMNAVQQFGLDGAMAKLRDTVEAAVASVPDCDGAENLQLLVRAQAKRLVPSALTAAAAA